ncbi:MAG: hypothetical protein IJX91_03815 [Clostridia bacterium]|nr:hypothetical protein [Clostridia bacterium]
MKKILCAVLALAAVFCFAGCENDKCDICEKKTENCKVYEELDNQELCPSCAIAEGIKKGVDIVTGNE